jgi:cyclopropane fatty-acyl-phospholipid synthase-like methyltransferase
MKNIKRMKLYHNPDRIFNELNSRGYNRDFNLKVQDLCSFDQYHYLGTDAIDNAINSLKISSGDQIIEIGSGIGGPARYLADKTGCQVTALEIQPELHQIGSNLTERCGMLKLVNHVNGDILNFKENDPDYDFILCWLSFLHIPDRYPLFNKCYNILKTEGKMYIEDYYKRNKFNEKEIKVLSEDISCIYLPTIKDYKEQLIKTGFSIQRVTDKTYCWKNFVEERMDKFIQDRSNQIKIHNKEIVEDLEDFYKKVSWLFNGGNLGGINIIVNKE